MEAVDLWIYRPYGDSAGAVRVKPRHWLARMVINCWAGNMALVMLMSPGSTSGQALAQMGPSVYAVLCALGLTASLGLLDNLVNDLMPERYQIALKHYRHIGYMLMAIALVLLGGITAIKTGVTSFMLAFLMPTLFAVGITWVDMYDRHHGEHP